MYGVPIYLLIVYATYGFTVPFTLTITDSIASKGTHAGAQKPGRHCVADRESAVLITTKLS